MKPRVIVIGGPTASGKTELSIQLAEKLGTEIINADSRQVYRELNIGVAKPTAEELSRVTHHFVSTVSITEHYNAGEFAKQAKPIMEELISANGSVVICGGTGLYIKALFDGLDNLPEIPDRVRESVNQIYSEKGLETIVNEVLTRDKNAGNFIKLDNPARVKRALELLMVSSSILGDLFAKNNVSSIEPEVYCIDWQREHLYQRINERVDFMMLEGLLEEVRSFIPQKDLKSLQTVGYSELFEFLEGNVTLDVAIENVKQHTRNYAKRQITWFKNQFSSKWISPNAAFDSIFVNHE